jgi:hypothetical protein
MNNLSPSAQAVLDAAVASAIQNPFGAYESDVAAALRAVAEQAKALEVCVEPGFYEIDEFIAVRDLLAIANELESSISIKP